MTEEARDHSFGRYLAAKKAAVSYGLSENFEHESNVAVTSSNSAAWGKSFTVVKPSDVDVEAIPIGYPTVTGIRHGAGKIYIVIDNYTKASGKFRGPLEILPTSIIASNTSETLFTIVQSGGMATQQPASAENESIEEIIWRVGTSLPISYRKKLASRLRELQEAVQEEESDDRGITVRSLQHFIEFIKAHPTLRCPAVSVTPDRNIYASWKSTSNRVFSIHFFPDGNVRFVIFRPNEKHTGEVIRLSGTATVDVVMSIAAPHDVLSWASDERPTNPRS
jgi:hypothetical protein